METEKTAKAKEDRASRMTAAAEKLALAAESIKGAKLKGGKGSKRKAVRAAVAKVLQFLRQGMHQTPSRDTLNKGVNMFLMII